MSYKLNTSLLSASINDIPNNVEEWDREWVREREREVYSQAQIFLRPRERQRHSERNEGENIALYIEIHKMMRGVNGNTFVMCKSGNLNTHGSHSNSKLINGGTMVLEINLGRRINFKFLQERLLSHTLANIVGRSSPYAKSRQESLLFLISLQFNCVRKYFKMINLKMFLCRCQ